MSRLGESNPRPTHYECRSPRSWDHSHPVLATVMGPPDLPVMGPPSARLPRWSRPAVCDHSRSFDLEVAGGVPGGRVHEVREVLRHWVGSELGQRPIAERAGVDRKTARRYIDAAVELGVCREGGLEQLTDELIGAEILAVRPERAQGHGQAWDRLLAVEDDVTAWVKDGLQLTNIHGKLARQGVLVPYRTLHRFAVERCGFGRGKATVRVADGEAGVECQIDF